MGQLSPRVPEHVLRSGGWSEWAVGLGGPPEGKLWVSGTQCLQSLSTPKYTQKRSQPDSRPQGSRKAKTQSQPLADAFLLPVLCVGGSREGERRGLYVPETVHGCELRAPPRRGPRLCPPELPVPGEAHAAQELSAGEREAQGTAGAQGRPQAWPLLAHWR